LLIGRDAYDEFYKNYKKIVIRKLLLCLLCVNLFACLSEEKPTDVGGDCCTRSSDSLPSSSSANQGGIGVGNTTNDSTQSNDSSQNSINQNQPLSIGIPSINHFPRAMADSFSVAEDDSLVLTVNSNDSDIDGDVLKIIRYSQGENGGKITAVGNHSLNYQPPKDFNGLDFATYTISDGRGGESTAKVTISVSVVNDIPVANADQLLVSLDLSKNFNVLSNDYGLGDTVSLELVSSVSNGTLTKGSLGEFTYTPNTKFMGDDGFVYKIVDANGDASIASVSIQVGCNIDCKAFKLSWDPSASSDVISYRVYMGLNDASLQPIAEVGNNLNFEYYTHNRGRYKFAVSAINSQQIESELSTPQAAIF